MKRKVINWVGGHVKPAQVGVYRRHRNWNWTPAFWDGKSWHSLSIKGVCVKPHRHQNLPWDSDPVSLGSPLDDYDRGYQDGLKAALAAQSAAGEEQIEEAYEKGYNWAMKCIAPGSMNTDGLPRYQRDGVWYFRCDELQTLAKKTALEFISAAPHPTAPTAPVAKKVGDVVADERAVFEAEILKLSKTACLERFTKQSADHENAVWPETKVSEGDYLMAGVRTGWSVWQARAALAAQTAADAGGSDV